MRTKSGVNVSVSLKELLYGKLESSTIEKYHFVYSNIEKFQQIILKEFDIYGQNVVLIVFDFFNILPLFHKGRHVTGNVNMNLSDNGLNNIVYLDHQDINDDYSIESVVKLIKGLPFRQLIEFQPYKLNELTDYYIIFDNLSILQILNSKLEATGNNDSENRVNGQRTFNSTSFKGDVSYESVVIELENISKILSTNKNAIKIFTTSFTRDLENFDTIDMHQLNNNIYKNILKDNSNDIDIYLSDEILKLKNRNYFDKIIIID